MKGLGTLKTLLAAGALAVSAGAVSASTLVPTDPPGCDPDSFTVGTYGMPCEGIFVNNFPNPGTQVGNDSADITMDTVLFGISGWREIVKVDLPQGWTGAETSNTGNGITLTVNDAGGGETSGTWSIDAWPSFPNIMVALKGGPTFSVFKVDISKGLSGTWNTDSLLKGSGAIGPDLSHMTVWAQIPLPAAGWLLLGGLGALGAVARRKRRKAA